MLHTPAGDFEVYRTLAPAGVRRRARPARRPPRPARRSPTRRSPRCRSRCCTTSASARACSCMTLASVAALARTAVVLAGAVFRERADRLPISPMMLVLVLPRGRRVVRAGHQDAAERSDQPDPAVAGRRGPARRRAPALDRGVLTGLATGIKLTPGLFIVALFVTGRRAVGAARHRRLRGDRRHRLRRRAGRVAGLLAPPRRSARATARRRATATSRVMYALVRIADESDYHLLHPRRDRPRAARAGHRPAAARPRPRARRRGA